MRKKMARFSANSTDFTPSISANDAMIKTGAETVPRAEREREKEREGAKADGAARNVAMRAASRRDYNLHGRAQLTIYINRL